MGSMRRRDAGPQQARSADFTVTTLPVPVGVPAWIQTPSAMRALQRTAGNQATTAMLLQRKGHGAVKHAPASKRVGASADSAPLKRTFISDRDTFVNLWLTAALAALEGAPE